MQTQRVTPEAIRNAVADRYSRIGARPQAEESIPVGRVWAERLGYQPEVLDATPPVALASFTGIGAPILLADLQPGERVLDLGCGAGLDSMWAARQVGPTGAVYGVDLAPGMVAAARRAVADAGMPNVTILEGPAEHVDVPARSIDVVLVNGLFNLVPEKHAVAGEILRTLRPGGRLVGAEIVLTEERAAGHLELEAWFR